MSIEGPKKEEPEEKEVETSLIGNDGKKIKAKLYGVVV